MFSNPIEMAEYSTGAGLAAVLALLGVSAPTFALVMSLFAFGVAFHALRTVNGLAKTLDEQADRDAAEITARSKPVTESGSPVEEGPGEG